MRSQFFIFIGIASAIIIGVHALTYFSWLRFFGISDPGIKRILAIVLAGLSVSFVITSFLVHWQENLLTSAFYAVASAWLGTLLYVFMSLALTWVVILVCQVAGVKIDVRVIGGLFLALAFLTSAYGLWNAQNPRIKEVTVTLPNLPPAWRGKKVVQISDVHLGAIHRKGFLTRIVNKINGISPEAVFITGDLFDGVGSDLNHLADPLNDLHPPLGTYFVTGNHETYVGLEKSLAALRQTPVKILQDTIIDLNGIQLVGLSYPYFGQRSNAETVLRQIDHTSPNILLFHVPTMFDQFKQMGVNLQLAGHTHVGQLWPFDYITRKVYAGHDYGLFTDGDYSLYVSSGVGTWGPPMRTGNRPEIVVITLQ
jgi:hypothetical protein